MRFALGGVGAVGIFAKGRVDGEETGHLRMWLT
jgi:hypothetical protein